MTKIYNSSFFTIIVVLFTCFLTGGVIGGTTNMVNGAVSPYYFRAVMYWDFNNIWAASVAQGIFEGLLYSVFFAIVFVTAFGIITKGQATYLFALRQLLKIIGIVYILWIMGGLLAMFLALLSPDFYKSHFPLAPSDKIEMLKFAWVGGSIWGGMIGCLVGAFLGIVLIKNNWKKRIEMTR